MGCIMPSPTNRPADEIQRLRVLKEYRIIDTPPEEKFDDLTRLVSQICEVPIALISLVESQRQWFKSRVGVDVQESLRNGAFCAYTILQSDLFIVPDALADARFVDNPFVTHPPNIRFYAGAPLLTQEGYTLGSLCILDCVPRELTEHQKDTLRILSRQVVAQLELRRIGLKEHIVRVPSLAQIEEDEKNIRLLMESTGEGIYGLDLEGYCTFCNPACLRILGYQEPQELYAKNMHALVHHTNHNGSASPMNECKVSQSVQTGIGVHVDDEILWRKDGTSFQAECWFYPVRRDGVLVGAVVTFVDITERKQAERNLQASEMYFRTLVENAPYCIHELDLQGRFLSINPAGLKMVNLANEAQLIKTYYFDGVATEDRARVQALFVEACEGRSAEFEFKSAREHASKIYASNFIPIKNSDNRIVTIMGFSQDITKHKQAEAELEQQRKFLRQVIDIMPNFVFAKDREGRFTLVNQSVAKAYGVTVEELIGKSDADFNSNPTEVEFFRQKDLEVWDSLQDEFIPEDVITDATGKSRWLQTVKRPLIGEDGNVHAILGVATDITARKQAEDALQELNVALTHAAPGISLLDSEGRYQQVNDVYANLLGYSPEELIRRHWKCTVDPDDHGIALSAFEDMKTSGKGEFEARAIRKDGSVFHKNVVMVKSANKSGTDQHHCLIRDITERKQMEQALREKDHELQQAQKMETIGTLAGGIAHDFNNILSGIFGFTELALKTIPENKQLHTYLEQVLTAASRARDLVKQILTFSRNMEIERRPTDPQLLLKEVLNFLRATLPSSIEIKEHLVENISIINADPTQIYQVIINLCANAEFALRETGGVLEIWLEKIEVGNELHAISPQLKLRCSYLCLTIQDTGQGMSLDVQKRIFDPFFTTKAVGEGAGMGLSVVHGIIASHGGAITVHSQLGHGTTFKVYLPELGTEVISRIQEDVEIEMGEGNVLLVEDEESLAGLGKLMIEQLGYTVEVHTSSLNALESFKNSPQKFDVVMSDQTMPTLTGEGLARKLLELRSDLPIILCTGYSHTMTQEKAKAMGIQAFLMKPLHMREVATTLQDVLRNRQQHE